MSNAEKDFLEMVARLRNRRYPQYVGGPWDGDAVQAASPPVARRQGWLDCLTELKCGDNRYIYNETDDNWHYVGSIE